MIIDKQMDAPICLFIKVPGSKKLDYVHLNSGPETNSENIVEVFRSRMVTAAPFVG